ncbi:MAG: acetate--CoA ligase family protein, partial [Acidimicrobiia bacterium]
HGVHRVDTMDEMADTLEIFARGRRARNGDLGAVLDSGGERTLLIDTAHQAGVTLATLSPATKERLANVLEEGLEADNPVDAWGTGHGHADIFETSIRTLADDPAVGVAAFCVDLTSEADPADGYLPVISRAISDLPVPLVVMANLASGIDPEQANQVRALGVPVLEGTRPGLVAIRHFLGHSDRHRTPVQVAPGPEEAVRLAWRGRLGSIGPLTEADGLALLADYGIPVVAHGTASGPYEAVEAAEAVGFPVAVKTAQVGHKSDVGGVHLGLTDADAVHAAYADLASRLGPDVIVQAMAPTGVEVALGIVKDAQFGPLVMVGAGGTLVELLADRVLAMPPLDIALSSRLVDRLIVSRLLAGIRGTQPADRGSLVDAIVRLSVLASDLGDLIAGLDINPLIVSAAGAVAVDALVIPAGHS